MKLLLVQPLLLALMNLLCLPDGYATKLSEKGGNLSGGQRQRVTVLAQYYLTLNLVMDEATSALDYQTELNCAAASKLVPGQNCPFYYA